MQRPAYAGGVTAWNPGGGGPDVLSSGPGEPRRPRVRTMAWAVLCLAVGGLLGLRLESELDARRVAAAAAVALRAGDVREVRRCDQECLRIPLFNDGRRPVTVSAIGFDGWVHRTRGAGRVLDPGSWTVVRFAPPVDCDARRPSPVRYVNVETVVDGRSERSSLRMPGATVLLREQHDRHCPRGRPVTQQDLRGVWVLEEVYGTWYDLSGKLLMRYARDGGYAWDSEGHLLDSRQAVRGRYRLDDGLLSVTVRNHNLCHTGDYYRWRLTLVAADQMHMRFVGGRRSACSAPDDEVWIARRVLLDHGLPGPRGLR